MKKQGTQRRTFCSDPNIRNGKKRQTEIQQGEENVGVKSFFSLPGVNRHFSLTYPWKLRKPYFKYNRIKVLGQKEIFSFQFNKNKLKKKTLKENFCIKIQQDKNEQVTQEKKVFLCLDSSYTSRCLLSPENQIYQLNKPNGNLMQA